MEPLIPYRLASTSETVPPARSITGSLSPAQPITFADRVAAIQQQIQDAQRMASLATQQRQGDIAMGRSQEYIPGTTTPIIEVLEQYLIQEQARGNVLNPNVEITPQRIAEFMKKAESEIDPYFSGQLRLAREGFLRSVGYTTDEIIQQEAQLEKQYARQLRQLGEVSAERGFAQSGIRGREERELAEDTQAGIDRTRRQFAFQAGSAAREYAKMYGVGESVPNIAEAPRVLAGQSAFQRSGRQLPFYDLSPDVYNGLVGEQEYLRRASVARRASELEGAEALRLQYPYI